MLTFQYAPLNTHAPIVTNPNIPAKTALILIVNNQNVPKAKPQTTKYKAITAFISFEVAPPGYASARPRVGSCRRPNDSQKTQKRPQTIIGKNCDCIQRNIVERRRSTGPVKKNMPLEHR